MSKEMLILSLSLLLWCVANYCEAPLVIQQCISHSLEALLLHHYLFKLTETVDFAYFCVSERPYQNKSLVMNTQWE